MSTAHVQLDTLGREDLLALVAALRTEHPDMSLQVQVIVEPDRDYGDVDYICSRFALSETTVRRLAKEGRVRSRKPTSARQAKLSIHVGDVREWMESDDYLPPRSN